MSGLWWMIGFGVVSTLVTVGAALWTARRQLRQQPLNAPVAVMVVGLLLTVSSWVGAGVTVQHLVVAAHTASQMPSQPLQQPQPQAPAADDQLAVGRDAQFGRRLRFAHQLTVVVGPPISRCDAGAKVEQVSVTVHNGGHETAKVDLADFQMYNSGAAMPQLTTLAAKQDVAPGQTRTVRLSFQVANQQDEGQLVVSYHGAGWEWQGTSF
ncbi:DUF4352 domain-containing protein [Lacticaseibacillus thailandensis]|uniref:DUF4352 domain-containing protein n=1 Tax=Lacticaseibacillus thailandensis DSM 22698 = JCM 13996 TaxID=1423810 RepID=A0A0R2C4X4_9LACO|nr:DUF4352 domain-containing protein [Lacticaseibacillus thailandensis]KRM86769.1 hypothetical protein FD19_GL001624 [Lacticaseibacillus thailandensis DSM 22698 = JCM 13996]